MPRLRFRTTWSGKLILQTKVDENRTDPTDMSAFTVTKWRDAKVEDLDMLGVTVIPPLIVGE